MDLYNLEFYGSPSELGNKVLRSLNIVKFINSNEDKKAGLYLTNKAKSSHFIRVETVLDLKSGNNFLITGYLTDDEINKLKSGAVQNRIFIIAHSYLALDYLIKLELEFGNSLTILGYDKSQIGRSIYFLRKYFKSANLAVLELKKDDLDRIGNDGLMMSVLSNLAPLFRLILNPVHETQIASQNFRFSQARFRDHLLELFLFLVFVIRVFCWVPSLNLYYWIERQLNEYLLRGVYFGLVHRAFHKFFKPILSWIWYKLLFTLYFSVLQKLFYATLHKFYYSVIHKGFFKIILPLYFNSIHRFIHRIVRPIWTTIFYNIFLDFFVYKFVLGLFYYRFIKGILYHVMLRQIIVGYIWTKIRLFVVYVVLMNLKYKLLFPIFFKARHLLRMTYYSLYGIAVDFGHWGFRLTKLYLMYPFYKIYWFTRYQYDKRIRKLEVT